jgi:hypothetical protein
MNKTNPAKKNLSSTILFNCQQISPNKIITISCLNKKKKALVLRCSCHLTFPIGKQTQNENYPVYLRDDVRVI